ncbi:MAG: response regulator [Methanomicrobiaceae archaeon]|nr:response regulator [Methanomicrobiaceae archaeon]
MNSAAIHIVENDVIISAIIKMRLEKLGFAIDGISKTAQQVIQSISTNRPDLILMDIGLDGDMDGIEAATVIQKMSPIPIIYLTGYSDPETLERVKETQPDGFLIKPFSDESLRTAITLALSENPVF